MLIHLSEIISQEGRVYQTEAPVELTSISFQQGCFPVLEKTPLCIQIENTGKKVLEIRASGRLTAGVPCDRCLEETAVEFMLDICRKVDMKLSEEERIKDLDESDYITGTDLDVDMLVVDEVLTRWPLKVLCREDCKGICSHCGQNLNHGTCNCSHEEENLDMRMAAIRDIFSKFKEV